MNARAYLRTDAGSDHQLVIANLTLKFKRQSQQKPTIRFDVGKLINTPTRAQYQINVGGRFTTLMEIESVEVNVGDTWTAVKNVFKSTTAELFGTVKHRKKKID
jgi:hypothetical protein